MTNDDEVMSSGWRKRQIALEKEYNYESNIRNRTLEEVAKEIEKMTAFGQDTIASFAVYIRNMKK
jgi:hypothetical protein